MNKKPLLFLIIIIALALVIAFGWWLANRVVAEEFIGKVKESEGDKLQVEGVYLVKDRPDLSNSSNLETVTVLISGDTKVIKERLKLPTLEEVEKTGGRYDPSKLEREIVDGTLIDFNDGQVSIAIKGQGNIYGLDNFIATEIKYIEPVYP